MKTPIDGIAGLQALVGKPVGASDWFDLDFADIERFAAATGDFQWIHVDRERIARESPFKKPAAHGYYSVARIGGLFLAIVEPAGFKMIVNYGMNKVRFPSPLLAGDRYRLSLALTDCKPIPGGADGIFLATIEIDGSPKPACAAEVVYRFLE